MGAYVVRTSSLNDKHSCQLFRMGLRDKTTPTSTTPLIRANLSCTLATIFSRLDFLSLSVSMVNLSRLVAASFSSLALLSSSVSTANPSCFLATTFSSLRFLTSLQSFESGQASFIVFFSFLILASYPHLFFFRLQSLVAEALFALSFSFLSERFFFSHVKAALPHSRNE